MTPGVDPTESERAGMVATQLRARGIQDPRVLAAMAAVPRHLFVPPELATEAYSDYALPLSHGQTISQPYMVARCCELAELRPGARVLEVGAGSGYQAAVLARLASQVISLELVPALAQQAQLNLRAAGVANVQVLAGDGSLGYPQAAPYDAILVAAAAPRPPQTLVDQLAPQGVLVIPVGDRDRQLLMQIRRTPAGPQQRAADACIFVPLLGQEGFAS